MSLYLQLAYGIASHLSFLVDGGLWINSIQKILFDPLSRDSTWLFVAIAAIRFAWRLRIEERK
jgi:hypothetical protein